jgi:hypothetical protein
MTAMAPCSSSIDSGSGTGGFLQNSNFPGAWVVQCTDDVHLLSDDTMAHHFGIDKHRLSYRQ